MIQLQTTVQYVLVYTSVTGLSAYIHTKERERRGKKKKVLSDILSLHLHKLLH